MEILAVFNESISATTDSSTPDDSAAAALLLIIPLIILVIAVVSYLIMALSLMKIFKKADVKPWAAWVPFYNSWKMLEIGGQSGVWVTLSVVPVVSIIYTVYTYIAMYHIGKKLEKNGAFMLFGLFLPIVWCIWLAVDNSTWHDEASSAPSIAK